MIILGLGSNMGNRLAHLRKTVQAIKNISNLTVLQVSPVYLSDALLPNHAQPEWNKPYLNLALRCETTLNPYALLDQLKDIELAVGRKRDTPPWGPRIIDIDILAWNDLIIQNEVLVIPHKHLLKRPFALFGLADVAPFWVYPLKSLHQGKTAAEIVEQWGSRFDGNAPFHTRQIYQRVDTPVLVGIINVTPDSFSDGGQYLTTDAALQKALSLVNQGAEVLDIGAESTAPGTYPLDPTTEWARLEPVLAAIKEAKANFILPPTLSIDTYHPEVAKNALNLGVDWINDVTGFRDPTMRKIIADSNADCLMMHALSIPPNRDHILPRNQDTVNLIYSWGEQQLEILYKAGITQERIIFDPGIGFGKTQEQSLALIKNAYVFKRLGVRVLIGHSRKSFLSLFTHFKAANRDIETMAITLCLAQKPIDYLRVHHVLMCARGLRVMAALQEAH